MAREPASFKEVACRVEIHLRAELEVLFRTARDQRGEMENDAHIGCDERTDKLRIGDVADDAARKRHARLVCGDHVIAEAAHECATDVACGTRDEYSHG